MSTVGRIGWMRALTKVLTRSRGTPAAAFAMYCSRKVLVDTELFDYNPCPPQAIVLLREPGPRASRQPHVLHRDARHRGVVWAGAADRRAHVRNHRIGRIRLRASVGAHVGDDRTALAVLPHDHARLSVAPGGLPEVPLVRVVTGHVAAAVPDRSVGNDAIARLTWGRVSRAALLDSETIRVVGNLIEALLNRHHLRLATRRGVLDVLRKEGELACRHRLIHRVPDGARLIIDRGAFAGERHVADRSAERASDCQRIAQLAAAEVRPDRALERA